MSTSDPFPLEGGCDCKRAYMMAFAVEATKKAICWPFVKYPTGSNRRPLLTLGVVSTARISSGLQALCKHRASAAMSLGSAYLQRPRTNPARDVRLRGIRRNA